MGRKSVPSQVRIRCGEENRGRFVILDKTKERWETNSRTDAIVKSCVNERNLRSAALEAVTTADQDGPLSARQLAEILSTSLFTIEYESTVTAVHE